MDRKWIIVVAIVLIVVVVGVIFAALYFGTYNNLVNLEVDVDQKWADVETVLQRRFDLIPNVVDAAKLYIDYEGSILENITMLRSQWAQAQAAGDENTVVDTSNELDSAISQFMVVVEAYPDLKANVLVQDLITELEGSENRIATERIRYNDAVSEYNSARRVFPANIWAAGWGFEAREFFEATSDVYTPPSVQ